MAEPSMCPRVVKDYFHFLIKLYKLVIEYRSYVFKGIDGVIIRIKRLYGGPSRSLVFSVLPFRLLLMYVSAVLEHYVQKIRGGVGAVYLPLKASVDEKRDSSAVVYVSMAQYYVIYFPPD